MTDSFKPAPEDAQIDFAMPAAEYHADPCPTPSLSSSVIDMITTKSLAFAWAHHAKHPKRQQREASADMHFGALAHSVLLGADEDRIVVVDADDWRTKAAREARDGAVADGKTPVLRDDMVEAQAMAAAARAFINDSPLAEQWNGGQSEVTISWREGDVWLKVRIDRLSADGTIAFDCKTTEDAAPDKWSRQLYSMGYHIQCALYMRALRAIGVKFPRFIFLVQERGSHECALYEADNAGIGVGDFLIDKAIEAWGKCLKTGTFPSYGHRVHVCECPTYLTQKMEAMASEELR